MCDRDAQSSETANARVTPAQCLHAYFRELGRPERRLLLALRVAAGEAAPTDDRELAELKSALRGVLALQRSGRGPRRRPPGLRSIVMTRPGSG